MKSAREALFDEACYQRFYFNKKTSVVDPAHMERLGAFVCSYLQYLRVPVLSLASEHLSRYMPGSTRATGLFVS